MKINNNITTLNFVSKKKKPHNGKKAQKQNPNIIKLDAPTPTAQQYKANSPFVSIVKPIYSLIPTKYLGTVPVMIMPSTIKTYLKNGTETDSRLVDTFTRTFTQIAQSVEDEYVFKPKEIETVEIDGQTIYRITLNPNEDDSSDSIMNKLGNMIKAQENVASLLANALMANNTDGDFEPELSDEQTEDILQRSYEMTEGFFKLSRTKEGYDFSLKDVKLSALKMAQMLEYEYGDDVLDRIIAVSKDENGEIDPSFVRDVARFLQHSDMGAEVEPTAELLKHFYSKDPEHKKEILLGLLSLDEGNFAFCDEEKADEEFYEMFDLCFDNEGKFDSKAFEALYEMDCDGVDWMEERSDLNVNYFPIFRGFIKSIIFDYFEQAKDPITGKFNHDFESGSDFFQKAKEKMHPMC